METDQAQRSKQSAVMAGNTVHVAELSDDLALQILRDLPRDLIEAQLYEAENDARRVAVYLDAFMETLRSEYPDPVKSVNWRTMFSAKVLLELAAALRVLEWEWSGVVRDDMQLPGAEHAARHVLLNAANDALQPDLSLQLVKVFAERFAWTARRKLRASVLLDNLGADDDQLADYLANLLIETLKQQTNIDG